MSETEWQQVQCASCGSNRIEETYGVCECLNCGSSEVEKSDKECSYKSCTQNQTTGTKYCFDHREPRLRT